MQALKQDNSVPTLYLKEEISKCEDVLELKESILPKLRTLQVEWSERFSLILKNSSYSKTKFALLCGVSRVTIDKWSKGSVPRNREMFIRIGLVADYDQDEMNYLLQRYGQYPILYSKTLEDCVCIYVLSRYTGEEKLNKYIEILDDIANEIQYHTVSAGEDMLTEIFDKKLFEIKGDNMLKYFVEENSKIFSFAYHRLYASIKMSIEANSTSPQFSVYNMSLQQGWSSSLKQSVYEIYQNKWNPTRNKIISLGMHLNMEHDEIDGLLELAHMEPLCAKNIFESVIMFILEDASLNDRIDEFSNELCLYAEEVLREIDIPEISFFITELTER